MIVYFCLVYELVANIFQNHERVCEGGGGGIWIVRIYHLCKDGIVISIPRITALHHETCQGVTNSDPERRNFLSDPHINNIMFFAGSSSPITCSFFCFLLSFYCLMMYMCISILWGFSFFFLSFFCFLCLFFLPYMHIQVRTVQNIYAILHLTKYKLVFVLFFVLAVLYLKERENIF